jgi:adenosylcobyric acid synthase
LAGAEVLDYHAIKEQGLERLAETMEQHLDMASLLGLLN